MVRVFLCLDLGLSLWAGLFALQGSLLRSLSRRIVPYSVMVHSCLKPRFPRGLVSAMILSEKLQILLKKWDFDQANALYQEYGDDELMKFLFSGPYSDFLNEKLKAAIQELASRHPVVQSEVLQARNETRASKDPDEPKTDYSLKPKGRITVPEEEMSYPKELQELIVKRKGLFAEANHARYILFKEGTPPEERKRLAFLIKANFREIERIWGILNYWKEHKTLSPDLIHVNTGPMTPLEMERRIRNLTTYISKASSGKKAYRMSIEEMQAEIAKLRRMLDGIV
jgi:hypothetical protein